MTIDEIKNDLSLRSLFFDLIAKNLVLGLASEYHLKSSDYIKLHEDYYESYQALSKRLEGMAKDDQILPFIQEVSLHYMGKVGRLQFINRGENPWNN